MTARHHGSQADEHLAPWAGCGGLDELDHRLDELDHRLDELDHRQA